MVAWLESKHQTVQAPLLDNNPGPSNRHCARDRIVEVDHVIGQARMLRSQSG